MSKPKPTRFPSDDFTVVVNGTTYRPHEGEYVELYPDQSVAEVAASSALMRLGVELQAAEGEQDELMRVAGIAGDHFDRLCDLLADRVVDWTWTDRRGNPMPKPDGTPGPIKALTNEEMKYLLGLKESAQETLPNAAGGSKPSRTTSLATRRQRSRTSSSTARSRQRD